MGLVVLPQVIESAQDPSYSQDCNRIRPDPSHGEGRSGASEQPGGWKKRFLSKREMVGVAAAALRSSPVSRFGWLEQSQLFVLALSCLPAQSCRAESASGS